MSELTPDQDELEREQPVAPPNDELRRAAQAVIDRWDSPKWKWNSHTSELINALRKALKNDQLETGESQ